jgi:hypothetical protein
MAHPLYIHVSIMMILMINTNMDPYKNISIKWDFLMKLPEDGPKYGPKHAVVIK